MSKSEVPWTEDSEASLVRHVKDKSYLWDYRDPLYHKKSLRKEVFDDTAVRLRQEFVQLRDLTGDDVRLKFKVLKSSFVPPVKKNQNGSSGMEGTTTPDTRWHTTPDNRWQQMFDHSAFISDSLPNEVIHSTFSSPAPEKVSKPELEESTQRILWSREAEISLIEKIREYPALWDYTHSNFMKKNLRREQFTEVARFLMEHYPDIGYLTSDNVRLKFGNLKAYYIKEKKKVMTPEGIRPPKWDLFTRLMFLDCGGADIAAAASLHHLSQSFNVRSLEVGDEGLAMFMENPEMMDSSDDESKVRLDGEENTASSLSKQNSSMSSTPKEEMVFTASSEQQLSGNTSETIKIKQDIKEGSDHSCSDDEGGWGVNGAENIPIPEISLHSGHSSPSSITRTRPSVKRKRVEVKMIKDNQVPCSVEESKYVPDFEYGIGLAISNQLRTLPENKKLLCATKMLELIHNMKYQE
ncbi:hypothetical protein Pcinc_011338 [Petrolisthes cinctipes]|uniref:MADF domain-containing protein n=1 Tax=Petrolisthes cinctipes TaxID=88211 RepID=A0AAE1BPM5_PETCI|nr:hypothetical protein Pcinc_039027 [Petrolisthes cinctipes]KAK3884384.1 hypothetical protein Pcinc_011338 [Petrolisthes cinctipes]